MDFQGRTVSFKEGIYLQMFGHPGSRHQLNASTHAQQCTWKGLVWLSIGVNDILLKEHPKTTVSWRIVLHSIHAKFLWVNMLARLHQPQNWWKKTIEFLLWGVIQSLVFTSKDQWTNHAVYSVYRFILVGILNSGYLLILDTPFNITIEKSCLESWEPKGNPPMPPPSRNKALLRDY